MKKIRAISILILLLIMVTEVCGCMNINSNSPNRKESNQEYVLRMQGYIQDKYSITVEIVEQILPREGINTALKENILVVRDKNGVIANVKARLSTPYEFYDDYVESCTAARIQEELDINVPSAVAKVYVVTDTHDITALDTSAANIKSLIFVSTTAGTPNDAILESYYEVYDKLQQKGYENFYFLVGFTDGSEEFTKAVENYMVHGKSEWKDYSGEVYAELYVTDNDLSFEEFKEKVN